MGSLRGQPLGEFRTVQGMYPGKAFCHPSGLITLQAPNEMPLNVSFADCVNLFFCFLEIILPEGSLARLIGGPDFGQGLAFADRQQLNFRGRPVSRQGCSRQALAGFGQTFRDLSHALLGVVGYTMHCLMVNAHGPFFDRSLIHL